MATKRHKRAAERERARQRGETVRFLYVYQRREITEQVEYAGRYCVQTRIEFVEVQRASWDLRFHCFWSGHLWYNLPMSSRFAHMLRHACDRCGKQRPANHPIFR